MTMRQLTYGAVALLSLATTILAHHGGDDDDDDDNVFGNPYRGGDSGTGGSSSGQFGPFRFRRTRREMIQLAHGITMSTLFIFLLPLGAILLRLGLVRIHLFMQSFLLLVFLAAFGMGAWMATTGEYWLTSNGHPIIGTIVAGLLLLQPIGGLLAHRNFVRTGQKSVIGLGHRWNGRLALLLGIINGGLGLQLAAAGNNWIVPYAVVGAIMYLIWALVCLLTRWRGRRRGVPVKEVDRETDRKGNADDKGQYA